MTTTEFDRGILLVISVFFIYLNGHFCAIILDLEMVKGDHQYKHFLLRLILLFWPERGCVYGT